MPFVDVATGSSSTYDGSGEEASCIQLCVMDFATGSVSTCPWMIKCCLVMSSCRLKSKDALLAFLPAWDCVLAQVVSDRSLLPVS